MGKTVYHYTSPEGIFGILNSKTLWFTDSQYLNDIDEASYSMKPFLEALNQVALEQLDSNQYQFTIEDNFIKEIFDAPHEVFSIGDDKDGRTRIYRHRHYVLCATMNADSIGMWNYYLKNNRYQGYNIGINTSKLCDFLSVNEIEKINIIEGLIIYNYMEQYELFYKEINDIDFQWYVDGMHSGRDYLLDLMQDRLRDIVDEVKLFIKNPAFSSEEEYRFILKVPDDFEDSEDLKLSYRVGNSGVITPYLEWNYKDKASEIFDSITMAPASEPELVKASFERFLGRRNFESF